MSLTVNGASIENLSPVRNATGNPTVSFVVLCFKLAHLLPECVNSILSQTYRDFEVLIMDDCSPDNTAEVAKSFQDPRVRYIRNGKNLGFLGNENEGIRLSRGKYVWIISADDYLRKPHILHRYVELIEKHPRVGYAFSAGVGIRDGRETGTIASSKFRNRDGIIKGHIFLKSLLYANFVLAPSVLVRRECYETISLYPSHVMLSGLKIDMVWAADWYLWCIFALSFDVAYFAEPMVCYREHNLSTTSIITTPANIRLCMASDIAVPWLIRQKADECGLKRVSKECLRAIAHEYALHGESKGYRGSRSCMSVEEFEDSLCRNTENEKERNWIRARFYAAKADRCFSKGDVRAAKEFYLRSLRKDPQMLAVYAKLFLSLGAPGVYLRKFIRSFRDKGG